MTDLPVTEAAAAYIDLFENLEVSKLARLEAYVHPELHFVDPFNDLHGIDAFRRLLLKTLAETKDPCFKVSHQAWDQGVLFLRWDFSCRVAVLGDWQVSGMSELGFANDGRVLSHVDHWDAGKQFYARLPVLGPVIRLLARRLQVS